MAKLICKDSVRIVNIQAGLAFIIFALEEYCRLNLGLPDEIVITSIGDGKHLPKSKHYIGEALDIRSHNFKSREDKRYFRSMFERFINGHPLLGFYHPTRFNKFRVLLENESTDNEHFHVQVKKGEKFP